MAQNSPSNTLEACLVPVLRILEMFPSEHWAQLKEVSLNVRSLKRAVREEGTRRERGVTGGTVGGVGSWRWVNMEARHVSSPCLSHQFTSETTSRLDILGISLSWGQAAVGQVYSASFPK